MADGTTAINEVIQLKHLDQGLAYSECGINASHHLLIN